MPHSLFPWFISLVAIAVIVARILKPDLPIDGVTVLLFIVALFPWVYPLLKSLAWGNLKIEFKELEDLEKKSKEAGLISKKAPNHTKESNNKYLAIFHDDPNLALTGLRIEIEKKLRMIAESNATSGEKIKYLKIRELLSYLTHYNLISYQERGIMDDLIGVLNRAAHGAEIDEKAQEWAIEIGTSILRGLEEKIKPAPPPSRQPRSTKSPPQKAAQEKVAKQPSV